MIVALLVAGIDRRRIEIDLNRPRPGILVKGKGSAGRVNCARTSWKIRDARCTAPGPTRSNARTADQKTTIDLRGGGYTLRCERVDWPGPRRWVTESSCSRLSTNVGVRVNRRTIRPHFQKARTAAAHTLPQRDRLGKPGSSRGPYQGGTWNPSASRRGVPTTRPLRST